MPAHKPEAATVDRIVAFAETMFAEQGYRGVSLRAVMRECGVNAAAVHYHFGSKEALLEEIFVRRAGTLNAARLRLLARCAPEAGERGASRALERILHAFLSPAFSLPDGDEGVRRFTRLRSVIAHENAALSQHLISRYFNETSNHFIAALRHALPQLPETALFWRFHFLLGAQYYTLSNPGRIESLSGGSCDANDLQAALDEMIAFVAAGFRAPLPERGATDGSSLHCPDSIDIPRHATAEAAVADAADAMPRPAWPQREPGIKRQAMRPAEARIGDIAWATIAPLLASASARAGPARGRKPITEREALDGIVYVVRHRLRWRDLPSALGFRSGASCWRRLREWEANGLWEPVVQVLREQLADGRKLDFAFVSSARNRPGHGAEPDLGPDEEPDAEPPA